MSANTAKQRVMDDPKVLDSLIEAAQENLRQRKEAKS